MAQQTAPASRQGATAPAAPRNSAARVLASTLGVYAGLLGLEHGYFELRQGSVAPGRIVVNAIAPQEQDVWQDREPAVTIIPNLRATGVAASIVSLVVAIWAAVFVQRKRGGLILLLFSSIQFLVGGGLAPIAIAVTAATAGARTNAPLTWWCKHLPIGSQRFLATLWPWSLIAFLALGVVNLEIAVFGNHRSAVAKRLPPCILGLLALTVLTAYAHDIQQHPSTT